MKENKERGKQKRRNKRNGLNVKGTNTIRGGREMGENFLLHLWTLFLALVIIQNYKKLVFDVEMATILTRLNRLYITTSFNLRE